MSVTFGIKNRRTLFSYAEVLSLRDAMNLIDGLTQFTYDETDESFDVSNFYKKPISELGVLLMGVYGESGRGFELSYNSNNKSYEIRVYTPSTSQDWKHAILLMKELSRITGSVIVDERGEKYNSNTISEFDCKHDVEFGIKSFCDQALSGQKSIIFGVYRPISISKKIAEDLLDSSDIISSFNNLVMKTQYLDAYSANQKFYKDEKNSEIIGTYALTQDLDTILPYEVYVEYENLEILGDNKVDRWEISLISYDDEDDYETYYVLGSMKYEDFINRLNEDKYEFIDGTYIVVRGLSNSEMKEILQIEKE